MTNKSITSITQNGENLYAGTLEGVFISTNNGISWNATGNGVGRVLSFAVIGQSLIIGSQGAIYYSQDSGKDWNDVQDVPSYSNINALAIIGSSIYAGTSSDGVWISSDSGIDWIEVNDSALNDSDVTTLIANEGNLYAGTDSGFILLSSDRGTTWKQIDSGLNVGGTEITSLAMQDSVLYAGSPDSGIWRHSLSQSIKSAVVEHFLPHYAPSQQPIIYPNPASETINIAAPGQSGQVILLDMLGRQMRNATLPSSGEVQFDVSSLPTGIYFLIAGSLTSNLLKE